MSWEAHGTARQIGRSCNGCCFLTHSMKSPTLALALTLRRSTAAIATDATCDPGGSWYSELFGSSRGCDWFGNTRIGMSRCAVYGAKYGNGGLVANQACCACGGGSAPFCPMDRYLDPDLGKCTGRRPIICRPVPQLHLSADPRLQCTSLWRRVPAPELPFVSDSPAWWASLPLLRGYPDATSAILTSPWLKLPRKAELRMEIAHSMEEPLTTPVRMTAGTDRQPYGRIRNPLGCAVDSLDAAAVWWRDKNTSNGRGHSDWHTLESHDLPYNGNKSWGLGYSTGTVSYTHLRAHETPEHLVCRLLLEKKKKKKKYKKNILIIRKKHSTNRYKKFNST
eukprot:TRINITY_DN3474_c0_g1_i26.p1 TRINITY_DN3474_c0_g1~~TRINITY_DN3474_c0_g1_i26.p1  ORF type:complete len:337 (-),score=39.74 TRINITY_DN3474_c0_g1_i26:35-1045(-)